MHEMRAEKDAAKAPTKISGASGRRKAAQPSQPTPWSHLDQVVHSLAVEDFPVTLIVQLGNALRRIVTTRYAEQFGLSESEWRMFTLIINFTPLNLVDLVSLSASDKSLVSRSVKALKAKGLISVVPDPNGNMKRLVCIQTRKGVALHNRIFPVARQRQTEILTVLNREERDCLYRCLHKLNAQYR